MNKKILMIGLVLLIVGAALFFGGIYSSDTTLSNYSHSEFTLINNNEHISSNITVKSGYYIIIEGATNTSGLVKTSELSKVNATDFSSMVIKPSEHISSESIYLGLSSGAYTYVVFGSTSSIKYINAPGFSIEVGGVLVVVGIILGVIGLIIMIFGAIKKEPKHPSSDPYDIDNIQF